LETIEPATKPIGVRLIYDPVVSILRVACREAVTSEVLRERYLTLLYAAKADVSAVCSSKSASKALFAASEEPIRIRRLFAHVIPGFLIVIHRRHRINFIWSGL
jgi:hypothetical protein